MTQESQISFFGGFEINFSGSHVPLLHQKVIGLLAHLAIENGKRHSRSSLLGLLWPELEESAARNNLRVTLTRLRKALNKVGIDPNIIESDRQGVLFRLDILVDVPRFETLIKEMDACGHTQRMTCAKCRPRLIEARDLYTGPLLDGFYLDGCIAFEEWRTLLRERLHLSIMGVLDDLAEGLKKDAELEPTIAICYQQLRLDPLYDAAQLRLLELLDQTGSAQTALQQFEIFRASLKESLGIGPSPNMVALVEQIKSRTLVSKDLVITRGTPPAPFAFPDPKGPILGRDDELMQLNRSVAQAGSRLITLTGPGGIGKTRLAIEAGSQNRDNFKNRSAYVPLAELAHASDMPAAILSALSIPLNPILGTPTEQLIDALQPLHLLLVMDNFEHLVDGGVSLILKILETSRQITMIVTSREELGLLEEDLFQLKGLASPQTSSVMQADEYPAVQLFKLRAKRRFKEFKVDGNNLPDVIEICNLVEGMPLALELAAALIRDYSCREIAEVISQDLTHLSTSAADVDPAHRSIQAIFDSSWDRLTLVEQQVLAQLSVFRGRLNLESAQSVANADRAVLRQLSHKSLLRLLAPGEYDLHALIRQLAEEKLILLVKLDAHVEPTAVDDRHSRYFLQTLNKLGPHLLGWEPAKAVDSLKNDLENIRQAWDFAVSRQKWDRVYQTALYLSRLLTLLSLYQVGETLFSTALNALPAEHDHSYPAAGVSKDQLLGQLLLATVFHYWNQTKIGELKETLDQLEIVAKVSNDHIVLTHMYHERGLMALNQGNNEEGEQLCTKALQLAREHQFLSLEGHILRTIGNIWRQRGNYKQFESYLLQAVSIQKETRYAIELQNNLTFLGFYRRNQGDLWGGRAWLEEARLLSPQIKDRFRDATIELGLAFGEMDVGLYQESLQRLHANLEVFQQLKVGWHTALCLNQIAINYFLSGDFPRSIQYARLAKRHGEKEKLGETMAVSDSILGQAQLGYVQKSEAAVSLQEAMRAWGKIGNKLYQLEAEIGLANVAFQRGEFDRAQTLIQPAIDYLASGSLVGCLFPFHAYYTCYQILANQGDVRKEMLIDQALADIHRQADTITDEQFQNQYFKKKEIYRLLVLTNVDFA